MTLPSWNGVLLYGKKRLNTKGIDKCDLRKRRSCFVERNSLHIAALEVFKTALGGHMFRAITALKKCNFFVAIVTRTFAVVTNKKHN